MATQNETPVRVVETAAGSPVPNGQISPINSQNASINREEWPGHNDSLTERFLYNLRIALSAWHT